MSYTKTTWQDGDVITTEKLNKIESGIEQASAGDSVTSVNGRTGVVTGLIDSPSSPSLNDFLVFNGTTWVAQSLSIWQGGSY